MRREKMEVELDGDIVQRKDTSPQRGSSVRNAETEVLSGFSKISWRRDNDVDSAH